MIIDWLKLYILWKRFQTVGLTSLKILCVYPKLVSRHRQIPIDSFLSLSVKVKFLAKSVWERQFEQDKELPMNVIDELKKGEGELPEVYAILC